MTIREGKLYYVRDTKVMLSGDPHELLFVERFKAPRVVCPAFGEWGVVSPFADECVEFERLPAYCIKAVNEPDTYIVLDTKLREILEAPFLAKVRDQEAKVYEQFRLRQSAESLLHEAQGRISDFRALPWWRRVLVALRGAV